METIPREQHIKAVVQEAQDQAVSWLTQAEKALEKAQPFAPLSDLVQLSIANSLLSIAQSLQALSERPQPQEQAPEYYEANIPCVECNKAYYQSDLAPGGTYTISWICERCAHSNTFAIEVPGSPYIVEQL